LNVLFDRLQPGGFPKDQTTGLTASVRLSITTHIKVNGVSHAKTSDGIDGVAGLVSTLIHLEPLTAILEHLRHKGHML
jgi:hypothetical protein